MKQRIIALTGKGGVGKTSISATIVRLLTERYPDKKILAIDADPAEGLSYALQVQVDKTIDQIRKEMIDLVEHKGSKSATELKGEVRYKIYDAVTERDGFAFIAIGRPETAGCYCKVNAYLKEVITLLADQFDYVVIDGEAGIEQVNRRVMEKVTDLLLITDASKKGRQVIETIKNVADELVMYENVGVIMNRVPDNALKTLPAILGEHEENLQKKEKMDVDPENMHLSENDYESNGQIDGSFDSSLNIHGIPVLSVIPQDENMTFCDIYGDNVMDLSADSAIVKGTESALKILGI